MYKTAVRNKRAHRSDYDLYDDLEKIKDAFADAGTHAKGRAGQVIIEKFTNLKDQTNQMQENVTDYITEKPFKTIGIAVLTGVLLGLWFRK